MPAPSAPNREAQNSGTGANPTVTLPSNPAAGDAVVLAIIGDNAGGAVSAVSGCGATWELARKELTPGGTAYCEVWIGRNCSGAAAVITATRGAGAWRAIASGWPGVEKVVSVVDVTETDTSTTVDPTDEGVVPVLGTDAVFVAVFNRDGKTPAGGTSGGFTALTGTADATAQSIAASYRTSNSAGVRAATSWDYTGPPDWRSIAVGIKGHGQAAVSGTVTMASTSTMRATGSNIIPGPMGLSIVIYDDVDPTVRKAIIENAHGIRWEDPFNDIGAGRFRLALADLKATADNLLVNNLVRCFIGPFDVFQFWIATPAWQLASPDGPAGEFVTIAGKGLEAYLDRGAVWSTLTYTAQKPGFIMRDVIVLAQARGAVPLLQTDFTATADSAGVAWAAGTTMTIELAPGMTLRAVLGAIRQAGIYARMRNDLTLQMWQAPGIHQESTVILRQGKHFASGLTLNQPQSQRTNAILVQGDAATLRPVIIGGTDLPERFESYVKGPETSDNATLDAVGAAEFARREALATAFALPMLHGLGAGEYEPYRHFNVGDWVAIDVPGRYSAASQRVAGINIASADENAYEVVLDLNAVLPDVLVNLARKVEALATP